MKGTAPDSWAAGLVVCTSGLSRTLRDAVDSVVTGAGGRYTPHLTRAVTHLLLDPQHSAQTTAKLSAIQSDRLLWQQHVVWVSWLAACEEQGCLLSTDGYTVIPPALPVSLLPAAQCTAVQSMMDWAALQGAGSCNINKTGFTDQHMASPLATSNCSHSPDGSSIRSAASDQHDSQQDATMQPQRLFEVPDTLLAHKPWRLNMSQQVDLELPMGLQERGAPWRLAFDSLQEEPPLDAPEHVGETAALEHASPSPSPSPERVSPAAVIVPPALKLEQRSSPSVLTGTVGLARCLPSWALSPVQGTQHSMHQVAAVPGSDAFYASQLPPTAAVQVPVPNVAPAATLPAVEPGKGSDEPPVALTIEQPYRLARAQSPVHCHFTARRKEAPALDTRPTHYPVASAEVAALVDGLSTHSCQPDMPLQVPPATVASPAVLTGPLHTAAVTSSSYQYTRTDPALLPAAAEAADTGARRTDQQLGLPAMLHNNSHKLLSRVTHCDKPGNKPCMPEVLSQIRQQHAQHEALPQAAATPLPASQDSHITVPEAQQFVMPSAAVTYPALQPISRQQDVPDLPPVHDLVSQLVALQQQQQQQQCDLPEPRQWTGRPEQRFVEEQRKGVMQPNKHLPSPADVVSCALQLHNDGADVLGRQARGPRSQQQQHAVGPSEVFTNMHQQASSCVQPLTQPHEVHWVANQERDVQLVHRAIDITRSQQECSPRASKGGRLPSKVGPAWPVLAAAGLETGRGAPVMASQASLHMPGPSPLRMHQQQTAGLLPVNTLLQQLQQQQQHTFTHVPEHAQGMTSAASHKQCAGTDTGYHVLQDRTNHLRSMALSGLHPPQHKALGKAVEACTSAAYQHPAQAPTVVPKDANMDCSPAAAPSRALAASKQGQVVDASQQPGSPFVQQRGLELQQRVLDVLGTQATGSTGSGTQYSLLHQPQDEEVDAAGSNPDGEHPLVTPCDAKPSQVRQAVQQGGKMHHPALQDRGTAPVSLMECQPASTGTAHSCGTPDVHDSSGATDMMDVDDPCHSHTARHGCGEQQAATGLERAMQSPRQRPPLAALQPTAGVTSTTGGITASLCNHARAASPGNPHAKAGQHQGPEENALARTNSKSKQQHQHQQGCAMCQSENNSTSKHSRLLTAQERKDCVIGTPTNGIVPQPELQGTLHRQCDLHGGQAETVVGSAARLSGRTLPRKESNLSLLQGVTTFLDAALTSQQKQVARQQLLALGVDMCDDTSPDTMQQPLQPACVVCEAQAAAGWLPRGVHLLSVEWLAWASRCFATETASPERGIMHMSSDILHTLHTKLLCSSKLPTMQGQHEHGQTGQGQAAAPAAEVPGSAAAPSRPLLMPSVLLSAALPAQLRTVEGLVNVSSVKARQQMLMHIKQEEKKAPTVCKTISGCVSQAPTQLLADLQWSVVQHPCEAVWEQQASDEPKEALQQVVYKGPQLILLLPITSTTCNGGLGHHALQLAVPPMGITALALLRAVYDHYQQTLSLQEQAHLMASTPALRRMLQEPFLRDTPVTHGTLLGPQTGWDGLKRCSRDSSLPVYVLQLSA